MALALAASDAEDPFTGLWKLNFQKSKIPPPVPRSETLRIAADTKTISITLERITDKGEPVKVTVNGGFDAKYYGVLASPFVYTVWFRRLDSHPIIAKALKSGTEIETGTAVVSKNGKTLTVKFSIAQSEGQEIKARAVYDKQ